MSTRNDFYTASVVSQENQDRVLGLGRGPSSRSMLQSPNSYFGGLKIIHCNVNGISTRNSRSKLDELLTLADKHGVDIVSIQETRLKPQTDFSVKGFSVLRKDRPSGCGAGGVLTLIRNISFEEIPIQSNTDTEVQAFRVQIHHHKPVTIINVYHPPDRPNIQLDNVEHLLGYRCILVGDFNSKNQVWGCGTTDRRGEALSNFLDNHNLILLNDCRPTYISSSYGTPEILDLTATTPEISTNSSWDLLGNIGSDHIPIITTIMNMSPPRDNRVKRFYWNFKKANWVGFANTFDQSFRGSILGDDSEEKLEITWERWKMTIVDAAKKNIPRGYIKNYIPGYQQIVGELEGVITERNRLFEEISRNNTDLNRIKYNRICAKVKLLSGRIKREKWIEICSDLNPKTPDSKIWKILKNLDQEEIPITNIKTNFFRDMNGSVIDEQDIANSFAKHYSIASKLSFTAVDKPMGKKSRQIRNEGKSQNDDSLFNRPFMDHELKDALNILDAKKTPGPDGIHGQMLKHLSSLAEKELLALINLSWKLCKLPTDWKKAIVVPIHKPNKQGNTPDDFRPISLTSIPCKIMERMILNRLNYFLNKNKLLSPDQAAYKKFHNTTDQVFYFVQKVQDNFERRPTNSTVAAFVDFSSAFDRVWRQNLIIKLDSLGVKGNLIGWIGGFLSDRTIRVKYNNRLSKSFKLYQGVPQGSILSPTLFSIYINGLHENIKSYVDTAFYADDLIVWSSNNNLVAAQTSLQRALNQLAKETEELKMKINPLKSEIGVFTINNHLRKWRPVIKINDKEIKFSETPKYLGVVLDSSLTFNKHIEGTITRAKKRLNMLKRISGKDWGADANTLHTTYLALVRPVLEYAQPAWISSSKTNLARLDAVQHSAARIICGLRNSCPNNIAEFEANLVPLSDRRKLGLAGFIVKRINAPKSHRTGCYIRDWSSNKRLKRETAMHIAEKENFTMVNAYHDSKTSLPPHQARRKYILRTNLVAKVSKKYDNPHNVKALGLETIYNNDGDDITIYTDGSKFKDGSSGSGVLIVRRCGSDDLVQELRLKNTRGTSVYRAELIAILEALKNIPDLEPVKVTIYSDSRAAIEAIKSCFTSTDKLLKEIAGQLNKQHQQSQVLLQWIPSHVGIPGNEKADQLAKASTMDGDTVKELLRPLHTDDHIHRIRAEIRACRVIEPHHWYQYTSSGRALTLGLDRSDATMISRLRTGHLKPMKFVGGNKVYPVCTKCSSSEATPEHLITCVGANKEDLFREPGRIIELLNVHNLHGLV